MIYFNVYCNLFTWQFSIKSSRGLTWVNLLLYHCMLGLPYSKFIYILKLVLDKIDKKILWFILELSNINGAYQQETFENFFKKGSSETICDITYDFYEYSLLIPQHKKKINKAFLEWLIGFTEGCGSFIVSKNKIYFDLTLNIRDIQVLYYIKKELGFGKVLIRERDNDNQKCSFYVSSLINFSRLIHLFNGNLSTNTQKEEFKVWLNTYNELYNKNVIFKDQLVKISLQSGWLSGFIDGESTNCFCGLISNSSILNPSSISFLKFEVFQTDFYLIKSIRDVFLNIETLELKNIKYDKNRDGWIFYCSSISKLKVIINYFSRYRLKTNKSLLFMKWCKIHKMVLNKEHLKLEGINKINLLIKDISKIIC